MTWATLGIDEEYLLKEQACKDCKATLHSQQTAKDNLKSGLTSLFLDASLLQVQMLTTDKVASIR